VKRVAQIALAVVAVWIVALFIAGFAGAGYASRKVIDRVGQTLQATATVGDASLGLVRGHFVAEQLTVVRADMTGQLALRVGQLDCDLAPLGIALVDRTCGELAVRDLTLELSSLALFKMQRPKRTPFVAERVILDNADLTFSPNAFLPSLGKIHVHIDHARAGHTVFKTPLSFLFTLEELRAVIELPAGITLRLAYANGTLSAAGGLFGSRPVSLPLVLPAVNSTDDAQAELKKLVAFGKHLAEQLVAQKAHDWLRDKLPL